MIGKLHIQENKKIFACCDKELLDTKLKFNDVDVFISSSFFGKDNLTLEQLFENIEECDCANIFGNKICEILLDKGIIIKEQIIYIEGIAHTQIYKM